MNSKKLTGGKLFIRFDNLRAMNDARYLKINLDGLIKEVDKFPTLLEKGSRGLEPVEVVRGIIVI